MSNNENNSPGETYLVGKRDFRSFFVTVCRQGEQPRRMEGFSSADEARAWVKARVQKQTSCKDADASARAN